VKKAIVTLVEGYQIDVTTGLKGNGMALKTYKPVTNAPAPIGAGRPLRAHKGPPVKKLTSGQKRPAGRNNLGRITVRWQGGGHKQSYRIIDFKRGKHDRPRRAASGIRSQPHLFIALIKYKDGELAYIMAPQRLAAGDVVISGDKVDVKPGNAMPLAAMPVGHDRAQHRDEAGKGGQIARAAGAYAQYLGRDAGYALLRLNSGEVRAYAGMQGDGRRGLQSRSHERGSLQGRPQCLAQPASSVRGTAMNPIDHRMAAAKAAPKAAVIR
jgi:large subunit ribosomal protein L2